MQRINSEKDKRKNSKKPSSVYKNCIAVLMDWGAVMVQKLH